MTKTLLIVIGLLAALLMAAGIMFNPVSIARRQLYDKDPSIRIRATYVLYKNGDKESIPEIAKLLQDNDAKVRNHTMLSLALLGDKESIPEIRKMLDADKSIKCTVIGALGELGDKESIPTIRKILNDSSHSNESIDDTLTYTSIYALSKLHDSELKPMLKEFLNNKYSKIRQSAVYAAGELGSKESIPRIKELLNDPEDYYGDVLAEAKSALQKLGVPAEEIEQAKEKK
mgnify:CR=1 FL=1